MALGQGLEEFCPSAVIAHMRVGWIFDLDLSEATPYVQYHGYSRIREETLEGEGDFICHLRFI